VLQGSKSLAHVVELAQRRVELVCARGVSRFVLPIALASVAEVHDQQNCQDAENNEGGCDHETDR
jgi:hypothetical protein